MRLRNIDLSVAVIIALLNGLWIVLPHHIHAIGVVLAIPLVCILPGYTLSLVLFHRRTFDAATRLLFSLGLSLVIDILGGLVLNALPGGIRGISWAGLLGFLTLLFSLLAVYLRRKGQATRPGMLRLPLALVPGAILSGVGMLLVVFSGLYAFNGAAQQQYPGFTQLWLLPAAPGASNCVVYLGVRNFERTAVAYRVSMTMNGVAIKDWSPVSLAPQQTWEQVVPITRKIAWQAVLEGTLYRLDSPRSVYRQVHITLYLLQGSKSGGNQQCGTWYRVKGSLS